MNRTRIDYNYIKYCLYGLILAMVPFLAEVDLMKNSTVMIIGTTLIYAIAALGLNVLLGYAGLLSLATAGFMGLAAYLSAYITEQLQLPFELSLIVAVVVPTLLGILVGILSLKFEGIYLAIATLVVSEILREIFIGFDSFTNGTSGALASYPHFLVGLDLDRQGMYFLIVFLMVVVFILVYNLTKGKTGRALNAMRGSHAAAQAMGINIFHYRLVAFAISAFLASVSGVLYVHYVGIAYPTTWSLNLSLDSLAIVVIGGYRSITGTLIGAFLVYGLTEMVLKPLPFFAELAPIIKGVMIILFILYYPNGIANLQYTVVSLWRKVTGRKQVAE